MSSPSINLYAVGDRIIKLFMLYGLFVALATEGLSRFNLLERPVLVKIYLAIVFGVLLFRPIEKIEHCLVNIISSKKISSWYFVITVFYLLPLLYIAYYYPPNNYDSMTYHLSRVEHWIQNENVEFYATNNTRQLFMSPFAEFAILHLRLLMASDLAVNFVQYFSMILTLILTVMVVKKNGGNQNSRVLAVVLAVTLPMGMLQSTSTQNDYVTAMFAIASIYFYQSKNYIFLSICIALGVFTKSTFVIFMIPLCLAWFINWIKEDGLNTWKRVLMIILVIFIVNTPHWIRNFKYFGSVIGDPVMSGIMLNESFHPKFIISNMLRNVGVQIALPFSTYNAILDSGIEKCHNFLGLSTNDSSNTFPLSKYTTSFAIHEDYSGNFIVFTLVFVTGLYFIFNRDKLSGYYWLVILGWLLFNVLLKWQPWQSRLMLPFFILIIPVISIVLARYIEPYFNTVISTMLLFSFIFVLGHIPFIKVLPPISLTNKPISNDIFLQSSRYERFLNGYSINKTYDEILSKIKKLGVEVVFLELAGESMEYPLWVAIRESGVNLKVVEVSDIDKYMSDSGLLVKNTALIYDGSSDKYRNKYTNLLSSNGINLYLLNFVCRK